MSPTNLASHYARLQQAYKEFKSSQPEQIFNIDESGFSTCTASRARSKALFDRSGSINSKELKWKGNAQHVTITPVVSGDGRSWRPLVVSPGKNAKYRTREDDTRETLAAFRPPNAHCVYREKTAVDSEIFFQWAKSFVEETASLRANHRNILRTMDGYGAHCTYLFLNLFRQNNIVAIGLPAHTSHRTQFLDYFLFSPFKTSSRNMLNRGAYKGAERQENDIYTLCEMLMRGYYDAVRCENIVNGFAACGIWNYRSGGADSSVIRETDITNYEGAESQAEAFKSYQELVKAFVKSRNLLRSDGAVAQNGTLVTSAGALLTNDGILGTLRSKDIERREAEEQRTARAAATASRRAQHEAEIAKKQCQRQLEEERKRLHILWLSQRPSLPVMLLATRSERRRKARLRAPAVSTVSLTM